MLPHLLVSALSWGSTVGLSLSAALYYWPGEPWPVLALAVLEVLYVKSEIRRADLKLLNLLVSAPFFYLAWPSNGFAWWLPGAAALFAYAAAQGLRDVFRRQPA